MILLSVFHYKVTRFYISSASAEKHSEIFVHIYENSTLSFNFLDPPTFMVRIPSMNVKANFQVHFFPFI